MRILIISMVLPYPLIAGGRVRLFNLIKHLSKNHSIYLICLADSKKDIKYTKELTPFCEKIEAVVLRPGKFYFILRMIRYVTVYLRGVPFSVINKRSHKMYKRVQHILRNEVFDCVQLEWLQMAQHLTEEFDEIIAEKGALTEIDVAYLPLKRRADVHKGLMRWLWNLEYEWMLRYEKEITGKFRKIFAMSEDDRKRLCDLNGNLDVEVIPNGVDFEYYAARKTVDREPHTLLFSAWMRHDPNVDGMLFFLKEIFPFILEKLPETRLYVVGANPPKNLRTAAGGFDGKVILTGFVEDMRDYLHRVCASIVPLRVGGGTRLKILESMAAGTAVVSTAIGCEGIEAIPGEHLLVADEPKDFANKVVDLLKDEKERSRIEQNASKLVKEKYDWKIIADKLERAYQKMGSNLYS